MSTLLSERIKQRRTELGMTQLDLALKMGYTTKGAISQLENGRPCTQKVIQKLATVLDVSPTWLIGWDNDERVVSKDNTISLMEKLERVIDQNEKDKKELITNGRKFADMLNSLERKGYSKQEVKTLANEYNTTVAPYYRELITLYNKQKEEYQEMQNAILLYGDELFKDLSKKEIEELKNYVRFIKSKRKD